DDALAHMRRVDLGQLEGKCRGDMRLLRLALAAVEKPSLAIMIGKGFRAHASARARFLDACAAKATLGIFARRVVAQRRGLISHPAMRDVHLHLPVALMVSEGTFGRV